MPENKPSMLSKTSASAPKESSRPVRLPGPRDLGKDGLVAVQVEENGVKKVKRVPAVDAREYVLHGSGTLYIDEEALAEEEKRRSNAGAFDALDLTRLRQIAEKHKLSWVGKNETALRAMLLEYGAEPTIYDD